MALYGLSVQYEVGFKIVNSLQVKMGYFKKRGLNMSVCVLFEFIK